MLLDQSALYVIIWFHQQLVAACRAGNVKTVQRLLSLGVNVNDRDEVHVCDLIVMCVCNITERMCVVE